MPAPLAALVINCPSTEPSSPEAPFQQRTFYPEFSTQTSDDDIVLQSSDGTCFYFEGLTLSLASTVFKDMLMLPARSSESDRVSIAPIGLPDISTSTLR